MVLQGFRRAPGGGGGGVAEAVEGVLAGLHLLGRQEGDRIILGPRGAHQVEAAEVLPKR